MSKKGHMFSAPPPSVGPPVLLDSGVIGCRVDTNRHGRPIYLCANKKFYCCHGESPVTILWRLQSQTQREMSWHSVCDCTDVDGLLKKRPHLSSSDCPPYNPESVFALLECSRERLVLGRLQRHAITNCQGTEIWVRCDNCVVCVHGTTRATLARRIAKGNSTCDCGLLVVPRRHLSVIGPPRRGRTNKPRRAPVRERPLEGESADEAELGCDPYVSE